MPAPSHHSGLPPNCPSGGKPNPLDPELFIALLKASSFHISYLLMRALKVLQRFIEITVLNIWLNYSSFALVISSKQALICFNLIPDKIKTLQVHRCFN